VFRLYLLYGKLTIIILDKLILVSTIINIVIIRDVKILELRDEDKDIIKEFLIKKIKTFIIYIFGSYAKGTSRDNSDIDIAFISDEDFSEYEIFMNAQELASLLNREIDLIDLKKSSTVFKAQVVGTGKTIYCNNNTRRMYFEMHAFKEYALLNEERAVILENIKKRGNIYGE